MSLNLKEGKNDLHLHHIEFLGNCKLGFRFLQILQHTSWKVSLCCPWVSNLNEAGSAGPAVERDWTPAQHWPKGAAPNGTGRHFDGPCLNKYLCSPTAPFPTPHPAPFPLLSFKKMKLLWCVDGSSICTQSIWGWNENKKNATIFSNLHIIQSVRKLCIFSWLEQLCKRLFFFLGGSGELELLLRSCQEAGFFLFTSPFPGPSNPQRRE